MLDDAVVRAARRRIALTESPEPITLASAGVHFWPPDALLWVRENWPRSVTLRPNVKAGTGRRASKGMNVSRLEKDLLKPGPAMWRLSAYERFPLDRHRALTGRRLNSALPAIRSTAEACGSRDAVSLRYTAQNRFQRHRSYEPDYPVRRALGDSTGPSGREIYRPGSYQCASGRRKTSSRS